MSYDENRISDLIDGGLKKQEDSIERSSAWRWRFLYAKNFQNRYCNTSVIRRSFFNSAMRGKAEQINNKNENFKRFKK